MDLFGNNPAWSKSSTGGLGPTKLKSWKTQEVGRLEPKTCKGLQVGQTMNSKVDGQRDRDGLKDLIAAQEPME